MGDWNHSAHCTETAKTFVKAARAAEIDLVVRMVLPRLRETARICGYALAVHGSLERDLDLIAVPWVERARPADYLATQIAHTCRAATGWGHHANEGRTVQKPHGRVATTIIATAEVQIDLSIMPLTALAEHEGGDHGRE